MKPNAILLAAVIAATSSSSPAVAGDAESFTISSRVEDLPVAVQKTRSALIAAAGTGDVAALLPLMAAQKQPPQITFGDPPADVAAYFRENSLDGEGRTALAALAEILESPYGLHKYGDDAAYVWPYLAGIEDLGALTPAQLVDAYRLTTPEALTDMIEFGGWYDYRVVITPDGTWSAFIQGD